MDVTGVNLKTIMKDSSEFQNYQERLKIKRKAYCKDVLSSTVWRFRYTSV